MNKDYNPSVKYGTGSEFEIETCDECKFSHSFLLVDDEIVFCGFYGAVLKKENDHIILPDFCRLKKVWVDFEE